MISDTAINPPVVVNSEVSFVFAEGLLFFSPVKSAAGRGTL